MRKWIGRIALGLVALAVVLAAGSAIYLRSSLPQEDGTLKLAGLRDAVEVIRDRYGVPHISASNQDDLFFALGFVHAQDRLAQMEITRRVARGRVAEVLGPAAVDLDRFMRGLDLAAQAEAEYRAASPRVRQILEAYSAGVNAWFGGHGGALPLDLILAQASVELWQPQDSLLWGKLMAVQLSGNWRDELQRARLLVNLPQELVASLWPEWPADGATTLRQLASLYRTLAPDLARMTAALPAPLGPDRASNEWVLDGTLTASGKPLLANDPHLGLAAPGIWYLARLSAPGLTLAGATSPGTPAVVLGHNGRIAWGMTTTTADTWDVFIERVDPADPERYLTPDGSEPFTIRRETIAVKNGAPVEMAIRSTRHGTVITDFTRTAIEPASGHVFALASPAAVRNGRTSEALFAINVARNWGEFTAALTDWDAPVQNLVYADVDGNTGFTTAGKVPKRRSGQGWLPQPGWTGEADWDGFVPDEDMPRAVGTPGGYFANANNRIVPNNFPVFIGRDWDPPFRNRRIVEMIKAQPKHDRAALAAMQVDSVSLFAREVLRRLPEVKPADDISRQALALLAAWDGAMRRERPEPLIFNSWMRRLASSLIGQIPDLANLSREQPQLLLAAFDQSSPLCGLGNQNCAERVAASLAAALADLAQRHGADPAKWRWDSEHAAPFRHQVFGRVPVLRDWFGFRIGTDGDYYTVGRAAPSANDPDLPFADVHGAGLRAVYDLADLNASLFMIAPGQSSNPLSPHWGDLAQPWADGKTITLGDDKAALRRDGKTLILEPANR